MVWTLFSDSWIIGISGGIISGIIVYFVTNFIISKKENKFYQQKIDQANSELLNTLKPYIISKKTFDVELYNSIISSLSKKYTIETKDLYEISESLNEIITEIMQTSFLTEKQKDNYSKSLLSIKTTTKPKEKIVYFRKEMPSLLSSKDFSIILSIMTVLILMISITYTPIQKEFNSLSYLFITSTPYFALIIIIPIFLIVSLIMIMDIKRINERKKRLVIDTLKSKVKNEKSN